MRNEFLENYRNNPQEAVKSIVSLILRELKSKKKPALLSTKEAADYLEIPEFVFLKFYSIIKFPVTKKENGLYFYKLNLLDAVLKNYKLYINPWN